MRKTVRVARINGQFQFLVFLLEFFYIAHFIVQRVFVKAVFGVNAVGNIRKLVSGYILYNGLAAGISVVVVSEIIKAQLCGKGIFRVYIPVKSQTRFKTMPVEIACSVLKQLRNAG